MNLADLATFNRAISLAEMDQKEAAHTILAEMRCSHPLNSRVLLCYAFTASDLQEASAALQIAAAVDRENPAVQVAQQWLQKQQIKAGLLYQQAEIALAPARYEPDARAAQPLLITETAAPTRKESTHGGTSLIHFVKQSVPLQICLVIMLAILVALSLIFYNDISLKLQVSAKEKVYWQQVRQVNEEANAANLRLQDLAGLDKNTTAYRSGLTQQLQVFIKLSQSYQQLFSPSTRFDKLDGLLGLAYNYYGEGAILIINGLEEGDTQEVEEGNLLLKESNNFLQLAREEYNRLSSEN